MLNELERPGEGPVAPRHGACITLPWLMRGMLDEFPNEHEHHTCHCAILYYLFLIPRRWVQVSSVRASRTNGEQGRRSLTGKSSRSDPSSAAVFVEDAWHGDVGDGDGQRV